MTAVVEVADTRPYASSTTARYSSSVPLAIPDTSWKTRYGALSSVPSTVQAVVPTGRYAMVTSLRPFTVPPVSVAPIAARPPTTPPEPAVMASVEAVRLRSMGSLATYTTADIAGTVTVTLASRVVRIDRVAPSSGCSVAFEVPTANVAVAADVELFTATTYSRSFSRPESTRENAKMPGPSAAYRVSCAPSASAGFCARSRASDAICRYRTLPVSYLSFDPEAPPSTGSLAYDAVCVANMSSRASLSPPAPMKPCSSP